MKHLTFRLPGGSLFSSPKTPELPPLPPVPTRDDPELEAARRKRLLAEKRRRGIIGTILTSGLGDVTQPSVRRPTLG
jgi:hypothetical protein